nr:NAD-dependent protein deacylase [Oceanococcus sp. HetDA_MAG_MS8]
MTEALLHTVARLREAQQILVLTGAGMSAESGLPTYRGQGGLYNRGQRLQGFTIEECLSASMLRRRPDICWMALHQLLDAGAQPQPHAGHLALAQMETLLRGLTVVTQNVDGLHQMAGSHSVVEMHGHIHGLRCDTCRDQDAAAKNRAWRQRREVPICGHCGGVLRPPVVLFEEALPLGAVESYEACLALRPEVVLVVGTSAGFAYIQQPVWQLQAEGAWAVDINPVPSAVSPAVNWHWQTTAAQGLTQLAQALRDTTTVA